jgi:hypothetical protein
LSKGAGVDQKTAGCSLHDEASAPYLELFEHRLRHDSASRVMSTIENTGETLRMSPRARYHAACHSHHGSRNPQMKWTRLAVIVSVNAFHEKAGRSQVDSFFFSLDKVFLPSRVATVATLPSALSMSDLVARCKLGVLVSAGAAT